MKRPLLVTAATATVVVGAFCGFAAHAYASEPAQGHTSVEVQPLVVPVGHQPTAFAPSPSKRVLANGVVVAAAPQAIDLDHPATPVGPDGTPPGRSGDTPADHAGGGTPGADPSSDDKGGKGDKGDKGDKGEHAPAPPAGTPTPPPAPPAPAPPPPPPGNNGNGNDNGKGVGNGKGNSSGKDALPGSNSSGSTSSGGKTPGSDKPGDDSPGKGKG